MGSGVVRVRPLPEMSTKTPPPHITGDIISFFLQEDISLPEIEATVANDWKTPFV